MIRLTKYAFAPDISKEEYYRLYDSHSCEVKRIPLLWKAKMENAPTLEEIFNTGYPIKELYINYSFYNREIEFEYLSCTLETGEIIDVLDMDFEEEDIFRNIISNCFRGYIEMYLYRVWQVDEEESEEGWCIGQEFDTEGFFTSPAVFLGYQLYNYDLHEVMTNMQSYKEDSPYYELAQNAIELYNNSTEETVKIEKYPVPYITKTALDSDVVIITEDANGKMYMLKGSMENIMVDWNNFNEFVPSDTAKVYFASINGEPISPYSYNDFYTLYVYLVDKVKLHNE